MLLRSSPHGHLTTSPHTAGDPTRTQMLSVAVYAGASKNWQSNNISILLWHMNQVPTYSHRVNLGIFMFKGPALRPGDINDTIENNVRHMHALWTKLSRQGLRQRSQCKLARGKGRKCRGAFQTGGCSGEYQRWWMFQRRFLSLEEEWKSTLGEEKAPFSVYLSAW